MRTHPSTKQEPNPLTDAGIGRHEAGVFSDGTAYLSQSGLAKLCGVPESEIAQHAEDWAAGKREGALAQELQEIDFDAELLYVPLTTIHGPRRAYTEAVATAFLMHYAFDVGSAQAMRANRQCMGLGLSMRAQSGKRGDLPAAATYSRSATRSVRQRVGPRAKGRPTSR